MTRLETARGRAICVIGNANLDIVVGSVDEWPKWGTEIFLADSDFRVGGSAANSAIVLQRLGCAVGLVSATGNDTTGAMIGGHFRGALDRIDHRPERTSMTVGILRTGGERTFFTTTGHLDSLDGAFFRERLEDWPLDGALALVSGGFAMPALMREHTGLLRWLRSRGAEVAIDPGWPGDGWTADETALAREWMLEADHILLNDMEIRGVTGTDDLPTAYAAATGLVSEDTRLVVKCGPDGAACLTGGTVTGRPAPALSIIDSVGAGDAFNAGYLGAVAQGAPLGRALETGILVAGRVISEFPRRDDPIAVSLEDT